VEVPQGAAETLVMEAVRRNDRLASMVFAAEGVRVVKTVFVPDKLLNVVVAP